MELDFELCDLKQNVLTRLDGRRSGGYAEIGRNKRRTGFCPLSLEDDARELAKAIQTVLRITLKGPEEFSVPIFIGRVTVPSKKDSESSEQLGLNAIDPMFQLELALVRKVVGANWEPLAFKGADQSQILWELINSVSGHGVIKGSLPASINRDRTYPPGKGIGEAIIQMSEVINGPDFELEPILANDGTLCQINTFYPRQGEDKSADVRFVFRAEPFTAKGVEIDPNIDSFANRILAIGAPRQEGDSIFPGYVAQHAASIALYGPFERRLQFEDVVETATLEAHAKAAVAGGAFPIDFFDFDAAPEKVDDETGEGVPPVFGIDYWIGDTVGIDAYLGGSDTPVELSGRLTDAKLTELDTSTGQLQVQLTCVPEITSAGITGEAVNVVIPEGTE